MANNELKLDSETSSALEAMRNEQPIEVPEQTTPEPEELKVEVAEPKKQEEQQEEVKSEKSPQEKKVSLAALHEAREELKAERKKNEELQRRTDERLTKIAELFGKPAQTEMQQPQVADPERDAMGALKLNTQQIQELIKYRDDQIKQQQTAQANQRLMDTARDLENEFLAKTPDYLEASAFLVKSRVSELMATGMYSEQQARGIVQQETLALAQMSIQNGRNPAEAAYAISSARGYKKKEEAAQVKSDDAEKIERIAQGQAASKSIGQAGGAANQGGGRLDGKALANMSDDEFAKIYSKLSRGDRAALMGN